MADPIDREHVHVLVARECPVCREDIHGPTTMGAAQLGLEFGEIFEALPGIKSRAWAAVVIPLVHRCHLN